MKKMGYHAEFSRDRMVRQLVLPHQELQQQCKRVCRPQPTVSRHSVPPPKVNCPGIKPVPSVWRASVIQLRAPASLPAQRHTWPETTGDSSRSVSRRRSEVKTGQNICIATSRTALRMAVVLRIHIVLVGIREKSHRRPSLKSNILRNQSPEMP